MEFPLSMDQSGCNNKKLQLTEESGYVSIFRIDGVPILPPLMTDERRIEIKNIKEKAIELEQQWEERRRHKCNLTKQSVKTASTEEQLSKLSCGNLNDSSSSQSSISQSSDDIALEPKQSYFIMSNVMNAEQNRKETKNSSTCTRSCDVRETELTQDQFLEMRMKNLRKSETLIYDNRLNTLIMGPTIAEPKPKRCQNKIFKQFMDTAAKALKQKVPAICIDPPTPLGTESVTDTLNRSTSISSLQRKNCDKFFPDDRSTDDSEPQATKAHQKVTNNAKSIQSDALKDDTGKTYITPRNRSSTPTLKRSQLSPTIAMLKSEVDDVGDHVQSPLARSNSFTLDGPSKALIDHLQKMKSPSPTTPQKPVVKRCCLPSASTTRDTVESKAKRVQKAEPKSRSQNMRCSTKPPTFSSYTGFSSKQRSPYEQKSTKKVTPVRPIKAAKTTTPTTAGSVGMRPKETRLSPMAQQSDKNNIPIARPKSDIFSEIEAEHHEKFMKLIAQQHEEQKKLQKVFEEQQNLLLKQLSVNMQSLTMQKKLNTFTLPGVPVAPAEISENPMNSPPGLSLSLNSSPASSAASDPTPSIEDPATASSRRLRTPRRQLFSDENLAELSEKNTSTPTAATTSAETRFQLREELLENQRRNEAATLIGAYAKGFLTRRLFRTEQIQRIVQTIRDTLIFVLNLHLESTENPEEANTAPNIKLKARLLQQLSSASRTLHLMFFQTSIKERMDIIARDRKRIKTKLLNLSIKSSPKIVT